MSNPAKRPAAPLPQRDECAQCAFFLLADHDAGQCRRHAPAPALETEERQLRRAVAWPLVAGNQWCGDFRRGVTPPQKGGA